MARGSHEKLSGQHSIDLSYSWFNLVLQGATLAKSGRGGCQKSLSTPPSAISPRR